MATEEVLSDGIARRAESERVQPALPSAAAHVSWLPITAAALWGTAFPAISLALEGFRPGALAFWRAVGVGGARG
jgi:hypothetical protein